MNGYSSSELMQMITGYQRSRIILSAVELNIFDELNGLELSSNELAEKINAVPYPLEKLLNVLTSLKLLNKNNGNFSNSESASKLLVKSSPSFLGGVMHQNHLWNTWSKLSEIVKDKDAKKESEINQRGDEWLKAFIAAMHARGIARAKTVKGLINLSGVKRLLDIGGGSGVFAATFINDDPSMSAVVFDLPNVVPITQEYIAKQNMSGRITTLAGNYLKDDIGNGYDFIFLSAVIHSNSYDENALLIKKCASALNEKGKIAVLDYIMNDNRTAPLAGAIFAINMLVGTDEGTTYTEKEVKEWMTAAGLNKFELTDAGEGNNILIGSN
ncbi:MAG: methyltransferase [Ignavibacteriaceae bacterium]|nr:methyltransferase [Ignavibacteriaceae bacterium]